MHSKVVQLTILCSVFWEAPYWFPSWLYWFTWKWYLIKSSLSTQSSSQDGDPVASRPLAIWGKEPPMAHHGPLLTQNNAWHMVGAQGLLIYWMTEEGFHEQWFGDELWFRLSSYTLCILTVKGRVVPKRITYLPSAVCKNLMDSMSTVVGKVVSFPT